MQLLANKRFGRTEACVIVEYSVDADNYNLQNCGFFISADLVGDQWTPSGDENRQENGLIFLYLSCLFFKYLQVGRAEWKLLNTYFSCNPSLFFFFCFLQ